MGKWLVVFAGECEYNNGRYKKKVDRLSVVSDTAEHAERHARIVMHGAKVLGVYAVEDEHRDEYLVVVGGPVPEPTRRGMRIGEKEEQ